MPVLSLVILANFCEEKGCFCMILKSAIGNVSLKLERSRDLPQKKRQKKPEVNPLAKRVAELERNNIKLAIKLKTSGNFNRSSKKYQKSRGFRSTRRAHEH
jgi:hypothetical protein